MSDVEQLFKLSLASPFAQGGVVKLRLALLLEISIKPKLLQYDGF